ncbi:chitinase, partial [Leucobacter sp. M11]|uniref:chitinase n=1 Tax=Leucobacter sp. M11 TaxID=2993565 RepID=UPI002D7EC898
GIWWAWASWQDQQAAQERTPWTDGYVDVTATPAFAFEAVNGEGTPNNVALAFIVAGDGACEPMWGGAYTLDEAGTQLDLDRRLERLRNLGGSAMISFGGERNEALAQVCADPGELAEVYRTVIDRYRVLSIDMDVEGDLLADHAAVARQAEAVAAVQRERRERRDADSGLDVWLTLPIAQTGLTPDGVEAVRAYLAAGVDLAGVNAMTMNFGPNAEETTMAERSIAALEALHRQLNAVYRDAELPLGSAVLWSKIAATPMLGQNNVRADVFTLDDAKRLNRFANERGMIRLSMWSLNRDRSCAENWADHREVSDSCSGVEQGNASFAGELRHDRDGEIRHDPNASEGLRPSEAVDDPAKSPYPIWSAAAAYPEGSKVVWRQSVYRAAWWTQGDTPDDPTAAAGANPWRLIGPVLAGETPVPTPALPSDALPAWSHDATYESGDRVLFDGTGYEARWWTRGDSPDAAKVVPDASPWRPLTVDEIREIEHAAR